MESMTLPKTLTEVPDGIFTGCTMLESVSLPDGVRRIGGNAFEGCSSLTKIQLPKDLEEIGSHAFLRAGLTSVTLPKSLTILEGYAFYNAASLSEIIILSEDLQIGNNVFDGTAYFKDADHYEDGVLHIGNYLISGKNYTGSQDEGAYRVKDGTVSIAKDAFSDNQYLCSLTIPKSVRIISERAFRSCRKLDAIELPDTDIRFDRTTFYDTKYNGNDENYEDGCLYIGKHLANVDGDYFRSRDTDTVRIKEGTLTVADQALYYIGGMESIKKLSLLESLRYIGSSTFEELDWLEEISVEGDNPVYGVSGNCLINKKTKTLLYALADGVIPDDGSVAVIAEEACTRLAARYVVIPDSVTTIEDYAFYGNTNIETMVLKSTITKIGARALSECVNCIFYADAKSYAESYIISQELLIGQGNVNGTTYAIMTDEDGAQYTVAGDSLFISEPADTYIGECLPKKITQIIIQDGARELDLARVSKYENLTSLVLPASVTYIESNGDLPESITVTCESGSYADLYCRNNGYQTQTMCAEHAYVLDADLRTAGCNVTGVGLFACKNCSMKKIEETQAAEGHTGKTSVEKQKKAGIGKDGYTGDTRCTTCEEIVKKGQVIPKVSGIRLSASSYTYDGKTKTPAVTVTDAKGKKLTLNKDYSLTFAKGRKNVGKYSVKVTLKGNYTGTKTLYFTILPKKTTLKKVVAGKKQMTVKWQKQTKEVTAYKIQYKQQF